MVEGNDMTFISCTQSEDRLLGLDQLRLQSGVGQLQERLTTREGLPRLLESGHDLALGLAGELADSPGVNGADQFDMVDDGALLDFGDDDGRGRKTALGEDCPGRMEAGPGAADNGEERQVFAFHSGGTQGLMG